MKLQSEHGPLRFASVLNLSPDVALRVRDHVHRHAEENACLRLGPARDLGNHAITRIGRVPCVKPHGEEQGYDRRHHRQNE